MGGSLQETLSQACRGLEDAATQLLARHRGEGGGGGPPAKELATRAAVLLVQLRGINRAIMLEEERVKADTEAAKVPVDSTTLQLHNLLYKKNHFLKAIKGCQDFHTRHPGIELVPVQEFLSSAPESLKGQGVADAHQLMLQRLQFELLQRKEKAARRAELEVRKRMLQESISSRRKFLATLPMQLQAVKRATLPLQEKLGLTNMRSRKQQILTRQLPQPLQALYARLVTMQGEDSSGGIEVEVQGNAKDVESYMPSQAITAAEEKEQEEGEEDSLRAKRSRRSDDSISADSLHPLSVLLRVRPNALVPGQGHQATPPADTQPIAVASLCFRYGSHPEAVYLSAEEDALATMLSTVGEEDSGVTVTLQEGEVLTGEGGKALRVYKWVQNIAGLDEQTGGNAKVEASKYLEKLLGSLRSSSVATTQEDPTVPPILTDMMMQA
eukprot:SM000126S26300  [mRNA]  locus=s126:63634:65861:- [translate_table: standard]